jgi:hypothetical protein
MRRPSAILISKEDLRTRIEVARRTGESDGRTEARIEERRLIVAYLKEKGLSKLASDIESGVHRQ